MSNRTQAANWVVEFSEMNLEALLEIMTDCLLNLKWVETPKSMVTASV